MHFFTLKYTQLKQHVCTGVKLQTVNDCDTEPSLIDVIFTDLRLKTLVEKIKGENEEETSRLTKKYQSEISDLKFSLSELEQKDKELKKEILTLKDKLKNNVSEDEVQSRIHRLKLQLEHSERQYTLIGEENDRLKDELSSVSSGVILLIKFR